MTKFQSDIDAEEYAEFDKQQIANQKKYNGSIIEDFEEICKNCNNIKSQFEPCPFCGYIDE